MSQIGTTVQVSKKVIGAPSTWRLESSMKARVKVCSLHFVDGRLTNKQTSSELFEDNKFKESKKVSVLIHFMLEMHNLASQASDLLFLIHPLADLPDLPWDSRESNQNADWLIDWLDRVLRRIGNISVV